MKVEPDSDNPDEQEENFPPRPQTPFRSPLNEDVESERGAPLNDEVESEGGAARDSEMPSTSNGGLNTSNEVFPSTSSGLTNTIAQVLNNTEKFLAVRAEESKQSESLFIKTTCLFCYSMISIRRDPVDTPEATEKRTKLVKNIYHQMRLYSDELPERCTGVMFPFCSVCKGLLENCLKIKEEFEAQMDNAIDQIFKKLVDWKIINRNLGKSKPKGLVETEANKFVKFRERIKNAGDSGFTLRPPSYTRDVQTDPWQPSVENQDDRNQAGASTSSHAGYLPVADILDGSPNSSRAAPPTPPIEDGEIAGPSWAATGVRPPSEGKKVKKNEKSKELPMAMLLRKLQPSLVIDRITPEVLLNIKKEKADKQERFYEVNYDADDDECCLVKNPTKRRQFFQGVELYQVIERTAGKDVIQCSACNFNVPVESFVRAEYIARQEVKLHIRDTHTSPRPPPELLLKCSSCEDRFETKIALRYHQRNHAKERHELRIESSEASPSSFITCDICLRPLKTRALVGLLLHKFTHKNDEEKNAAIEAREVGIPAIQHANPAEEQPRANDCPEPEVKQKVKKKKKVVAKSKAEGNLEEQLHIMCSSCNIRFKEARDLVAHASSCKGKSSKKNGRLNEAASTSNDEDRKKLKRNPLKNGNAPTLTPQKKRKAGDSGSETSSKGNKSKRANGRDSRGKPKAGHSRGVDQEEEEEDENGLPVLEREDE